MKNFLFFFGTFLVFNMAIAQQEISTAYATQANYTFAPLNKLRIPHGILLDLVWNIPILKLTTEF